MKLTPCFSPVLLLCVAAMARAVATDDARPWPAEPQFLPVTPERIAGLPASEQPAWRAYWDRSQAFAAKLAQRETFAKPSTERLSGPGIPSKQSNGLRLTAPKTWYAGEAAQAVADRVVAAQSAAGGWDKGHNYTGAAGPKTEKPGVWSGGTFDNNATTWEMRFLALVATAAGDTARSAPWRDSFVRGLRYMLAAQYPNGGFPQIYPLGGGYHDAITFNDNAMVQVLELLRDVGGGKEPFAFVPADLRADASSRVSQGIACILATQISDSSGRGTAWCQQHDAITLAPCAARNFEPVAACTSESASLTRFLMTLPDPEPGVDAAIKGAITWFERTKLQDVAWTRRGGAGQLVAQAGAPPLWARMYEIGTDKPIFGDRDRTIHYAVGELSEERRAGYGWYGTWPTPALEEFAARPARMK